MKVKLQTSEARLLKEQRNNANVVNKENEPKFILDDNNNANNDKVNNDSDRDMKMHTESKEE